MGVRNQQKGKEFEALDRLIEEITVDAYGDDQQLSAFRQAFEDEVALPADGFVIGEPVSVIAVDYVGNEWRGLTARCRREVGPNIRLRSRMSCCRRHRQGHVTSPLTAGGSTSILTLSKPRNLPEADGSTR